MSEFTLYDSDFTPLGILQNEISVIWVEKFKDYGEVKIIARASESNKKFLKNGNYISTSDFDTVAQICNIVFYDNNGESLIEARAYTTVKMMDDRVVMNTQTVSNVGNAMYDVYEQNKRGLPFFVTRDEIFHFVIHEMEITWNSILDMLKTLSEISPFGFKVTFDKKYMRQEFKVYSGTDRRPANYGISYVGYIGSDLGNIYNIKMESGISNFKNIAIVAGEDSGTNRIVREVKLSPDIAPEDRRELYVDDRHIQSEYQVKNTTGEIDSDGNVVYTTETKQYTAAQYAALLDASGNEKLSEHIKNFAISCSVSQINMIFGKDYFIGDKIPVKIEQLGFTALATVSEARVETEYQNKNTIITLNDFEVLEES